MAYLRTVLALVLAVPLLAACAGSIKTGHDSDPNVDLGGFKSWAWIGEDPAAEAEKSPSQNRFVSALDERRLRAAIESQMQAKGYRRAPLQTADLVVSFTVTTEQRVQVDQTPGRSSVHHRGYHRRDWYRGSTALIQTYTEGTLVIDFFDRQSREAIWVGWGSKRLTENNDPEKAINRAVSQILEPFPSRIAGG
jgi:hypothetical protein